MPLSNVPRWSAIGALLLCLLRSITAVGGTKEVPGLDIQKITTPLYDTISHACSKSAPFLDGLLKGSYFPKSSICRIETSFEEDNSESYSELTNTDLESIEGGETENKHEKVPGNDFILFALNASPEKNDSKREHLLKKRAFNVNDDFTQNLCEKLARDACHIANAHTSAMTRSMTTCLCVVLRDTNGRAKKFVFHNGKSKMPATMAQKAKELNYAIRTGYQAHAEAVFIQFLLQRKQQNSERYTHILGMGCSRRHCKECDCLMKLSLGKQYPRFTAAMREQDFMPVVTHVEGGCDIHLKVHAALVHENNAVKHDGKRSERYYLPKVLQEYICKKLALELDFSSDRFTIKDEEAVVARRQRSDRKS